MSSSSNSHSPCAACKFLRRKCTQECVFAPYFPPEQPQKFASVHRVYGASNVAKILNDMPVAHREEAVASLAYEAEARLRDPVHGCVSFITYLHARLKHIQAETIAAKKELAAYTASSHPMIMMYSSPSAPGPFAAQPGSQLAMLHQNQPMVFDQNPNTHVQNQHGFSGFLGDCGGAAVGQEGYVVLGNEGYHNHNQIVQVQPQPQPHPHQVVQGHDYLHHNMLLLHNVPHGQDHGGVDGNDQEP